MPSQTEAVRAHVRISGRVQGVGFRYSTADEARRRKLGGWVRNLESGAVEAVFEGPPQAIQEMVRWCQQGPPGAWVRDLKVAWDEPLENLKQFEIRRTTFD
jgi:acylphosphatase